MSDSQGVLSISGGPIHVGDIAQTQFNLLSVAGPVYYSGGLHFIRARHGGYSIRNGEGVLIKRRDEAISEREETPNG